MTGMRTAGTPAGSAEYESRPDLALTREHNHTAAHTLLGMMQVL